jgi:hypothetical protein
VTQVVESVVPNASRLSRPLPFPVDVRGREGIAPAGGEDEILAAPARARGNGLTALNRSLNYSRVELYAATMVAGDWYDSPDPVVISKEGLILNGQHRLAAAAQVEWEEGDRIPQIVVVWDADKEAALLMDEAKRSANDRRDIALKYARANGGGA